MTEFEMVGGVFGPVEIEDTGKNDVLNERSLRVADWMLPSSIVTGRKNPFFMPPVEVEGFVSGAPHGGRKTQQTTGPKGRKMTGPTGPRTARTRSMGMVWRETGLISPQPDWIMVEEIDISRLSKPGLDRSSETLFEQGTLYFYDKAIDRATARAPKTLSVDPASESLYCPAMEDSFLLKLAEEGAGHVFSTDSVIAMLMAASRSVIAWEALVTKRDDGRIFIDARPGVADASTVNETAPEGPPEFSERERLHAECLAVSCSFSKNCLKSGDDVYELGGSEAKESVRYRRWRLGDGLYLVIRSNIDAAMRYQDAVALISTRALLEYGTGWRSKLDVQRGAVLVTEVRNNGCKLARWAYQSILSGVDILKIGFVSRAQSRYEILGTFQWHPDDFISQTHMNPDLAFSLLHSVLETIRRQPPGSYVLSKPSSKPLFTLYALPQ